MFIMTNVNVASDLIQVYDSKDGSNDAVRLSLVASQVLQKKLKIYGVGTLANRRRNDIIPLEPYGIYICYNEAKEALATMYQKNGYSREAARAAVGLV